MEILKNKLYLLVKQKIVKISGSVYYPGDYVLESPTDKITSIIKRAGGLRPEAHIVSSQLRRDSILIQVSFDKLMKSPRSKFNINLLPGDEIIVKPNPNIIKIEPIK